jgi:CRISPR system Cascade subunit CasD
MSEPILLLRLEAPLQAWGLRARWDIRDSAREPTKSGVIGLIASALGYERDDPRIADELDAGLRMGVRVEQEAGLLDDYQTVTDFLPIAKGGFKHSGVRTAAKLDALLGAPDVEPSTIQSMRRYLTDGSFLVALAATPTAAPDLLRRCAGALERPHWPLFLGRRACIPTRPILEALTENYENLEDALRRHPWSCLGVAAVLRQRRGAGGRLRIIMESEQTTGGGGRVPRDDRRQNGPARLYGRRWVHEYYVEMPVISGQEGQ